MIVQLLRLLLTIYDALRVTAAFYLPKNDPRGLRLKFGLGCVIASYLVHWPLMAIIGYMSVLLHQPVIAGIGMVWTYGLTTVLMFAGMKLAGRQAPRLALEAAVSAIRRCR